MSKGGLRAVATSAVLAFGMIPAQAATLSFEHSGFNFGNYPFSYQQDGFSVSNVGPTGLAWGPGAQPSWIVSVTRTDGGSFTFSRFDAGTFSGSDVTMLITSTLAGGGAGPNTQIIASFNKLATFDLSPTFTDTLLRSISFDFGNQTAAYASFIDNVSVTVTAVPGPIAGAGLPALLALGGFVWATRRKTDAFGTRA